MSASFHHVRHVVEVESDNKMRRIATRTIVTFVSDEKVAWVTVLSGKRVPMRTHYLWVVCTKLSISSIFVSISLPWPTFIRKSYFDFRPESFGYYIAYDHRRSAAGKTFSIVDGYVSFGFCRDLFTVGIVCALD